MKKNYKLSLLFLFKSLIILFLFTQNLLAEVSYKEVKAKGVDKIYEVALKKAFKQAIKKVNGITIQIEDLFKTIDADIKVKGTLLLNNQSSSGEYTASASYRELQKILSEKTKGSIKSFEILNESKDAGGVYYIEILAKIAQFELSEIAKRKRIAIIPFRINENNFSINDNIFSSADFKDFLNHELTTYFVQTKKFTVLDRKFNEEIAEELNNLNNSDKIDDQIKIGQKLFADYILVGKVYSFQIKEIEKKFLTSDVVVKKNIGNLILSYRIIDVPTAQIIYSSNYEHETDLKKVSQPLKYFSNLAVKNLGTKIIYEIYPIMVENFEDNLLYLSQGGEQIKTGDLYTLFERTDKKIIDSYTGEILGNIEKKIGIVEIVEIHSGYSVAKIKEVKIDLISQFKPLSYLVKPYEVLEEKTKIKKKIKKKKDLDKIY